MDNFDDSTGKRNSASENYQLNTFLKIKLTKLFLYEDDQKLSIVFARVEDNSVRYNFPRKYKT